jgi:hypothetical protein
MQVGTELLVLLPPLRRLPGERALHAVWHRPQRARESAHGDQGEQDPSSRARQAQRGGFAAVARDDAGRLAQRGWALAGRHRVGPAITNTPPGPPATVPAKPTRSPTSGSRTSGVATRPPTSHPDAL